MGEGGGDGGGGTTIECSILVDNILWYYSPPSVGLSGRPSLGFLKIGWLVFSDIVHEDSWPWYLVTDGARFKKKKIEVPNVGQMDQDQAQI